MIQCPPGWREWRAADCMVYAFEDQSHQCTVTYQERQAPLRSIKVTAREIIANDKHFELAEEYRITRFLTHEGEYGAYMGMSGVRCGKRVAYCFASVFTEYFNTSVIALADLERLETTAAMVLELAQHDQLRLGVRRRRVGFTPPKNWHPIPGIGLDMVLLPPNYPQTHASITVYPAVPVELATDPLLVQRQHDARVGLPRVVEKSKMARTRPTKRNIALVGKLWTSQRPLPNNQGYMLRNFVVLRDARYVYSTKLELLEGPRNVELHDVFLDMMGTIEPIPQPDVATRTFDMWDD